MVRMAEYYDKITGLEGRWIGTQFLGEAGIPENEFRAALFECWLMIQSLSGGDLDMIANAKEAAYRIKKAMVDGGL